MTAREHLAKVLTGTGLYQLTGSTPVDWELSAYGAGFALVEQRLERLLGDLFAATASRERLAQWERLFRTQPSTAPLEDCRDQVHSRLAVTPDCFTLEALNGMLPGGGVRGILQENGSSLTVVLGKLLGITQEEAARELDRLLPAHLSWTWEEAITWVALDAYSQSFAQWDALGKTWEELDSLTRENLESDFEEVI
ncbi:MAG: hypothetical protein ACOYJZ_06630 [Acutalibacter sp.]|jgi:hypothetical protein